MVILYTVFDVFECALQNFLFSYIFCFLVPWDVLVVVYKMTSSHSQSRAKYVGYFDFNFKGEKTLTALGARDHSPLPIQPEA